MKDTTDRRAAQTGRMTHPHHPQQQPPSEQLIDDFVLARIDFRVRRLASMFGLDESRQDDLRQDMVVELLNAAERFDPAKAKWHTFACRVLDLAVKKLIQLECRRRQREAGRPLGHSRQSDGETPLGYEPIDPHDGIAELQTRLDLSDVLQEMPQRLREACEQLKVHPRPRPPGRWASTATRSTA